MEVVQHLEIVHLTTACAPGLTAEQVTSLTGLLEVEEHLASLLDLPVITPPAMVGLHFNNSHNIEFLLQ